MGRLAGCAALLAATLLLSACGVAYDRTKGWANRLSDWADKELETLEQDPPEWQEPERSLVSDPSAAEQLAYTAASAPTRRPRSRHAGRPGRTGHKAPTAATTGQSRVGNNAPPLPRTKPRQKATAAQPEAAQAGYIVHLASMRSQSSAHREWQQLQRTYPRYLRKLKVSIKKIDLGKRGVFYRVLAGPFPDKRTASQVCSGLQTQSQYCSIVENGAKS